MLLAVVVGLRGCSSLLVATEIISDLVQNCVDMLDENKRSINEAQLVSCCAVAAVLCALWLLWLL